MRVVDTSAWIEWLSASALEKKIVPHLPEDADWLVPTIIQFELAKWLRRESADADRTQRIMAFSATCVVAPLTSSIAIAAAHFGNVHRLPTADALVYATAREFDAGLLTCDAHFKELPGVIYVPKTA